RQQIRPGRFAGARYHHDRNRGDRRRMKANTPERGQYFRVAEAHVLVANIARDSRAAGISELGYKSRLDWFIENLEYEFARGAPSLHKLIKLMQAADRIVKK